MAILSNGVEEDKRKKTQESELIGDSAWNGNSAWMDLLFRKGIIGISMYFMEFTMLVFVKKMMMYDDMTNDIVREKTY